MQERAAWVPAFAGMTALRQGKIKMGPSVRWDDGLVACRAATMRRYGDYNRSSATSTFIFLRIADT